jgi:hypothetical protein
MTRNSSACAGRRREPVCASRHQESGPRQERGFALLVIFLIAAAVAFTMYRELPRAAFESARDKEQLLMDRGNQYKRAIQVYYAVNKRYPAELKDLENTNDKRFLRRRYKDPMTGEEQWRLIHTNGSFLTDSLIQKPPAQNAGNGLPGAGQTPGGGPLGANNLNTAPTAPAAANASTANNANDPAFAVTGPALQNPAAQRRPSDRGFPTGPGFPQQPGFNPANPNPAGANPFGANPANFDPSDPRTWPPITLAPANAQPGQLQQQGLGQPQPNAQIVGGQPAVLNPPFGAAQPGGVGQPFPGQAFPGQPVPGQPGLNGQPAVPFGVVQPQVPGIPGQLPGLGGANPQPVSLVNPNPLGQNAPAPAIAQNSDQNPALVNINQSMPPPNQPAPVPQPVPPYNGGQPLNTGQQFNGGSPFGPASGFNPQQQPAPFQNPGVTGAQPNPALPGNASGNAPNNAALQAINNSLFRPNQAPAAGPTGSPGIAGVASKFEGPSIKAYRQRTKYQEWEFVYEPATNQPGQAGVPGQNPQQNQNGPGQNGLGQNGGPGLGQTPTGGANPASPSNPFAPSNPFSQPNPFAPTTPQR